MRGDSPHGAEEGVWKRDGCPASAPKIAAGGVRTAVNASVAFADSEGVSDYYGSNNVVKKEQWSKIVEKSKENKHRQSVIEELMPWVEECFTVHDCFTVCGI